MGFKAICTKEQDSTKHAEWSEIEDSIWKLYGWKNTFFMYYLFYRYWRYVIPFWKLKVTNKVNKNELEIIKASIVKQVRKDFRPIP